MCNLKELLVLKFKMLPCLRVHVNLQPYFSHQREWQLHFWMNRGKWGFGLNKLAKLLYLVIPYFPDCSFYLVLFGLYFLLPSISWTSKFCKKVLFYSLFIRVLLIQIFLQSYCVWEELSRKTSIHTKWKKQTSGHLFFQEKSKLKYVTIFTRQLK